MKRGYDFGIFSEEEEEKYIKWRNLRDRFFHPLCVHLAKLRIPPAFLSYAGLLTVVPFIIFFPINPWFSFFAILANVFFDSIDGPYARYTKKDSSNGALTDMICDYGSFIVFFMTIFFYGLMNRFWAGFYIVNYAVMISLVIFCHKKKINFFPVIRSKYYFYGIFLILLISGRNIFDPFLVFFSVYMLISNILLADKLRCSIR